MKWNPQHPTQKRGVRLLVSLPGGVILMSGLDESRYFKSSLEELPIHTFTVRYTHVILPLSEVVYWLPLV